MQHAGRICSPQRQWARALLCSSQTLPRVEKNILTSFSYMWWDGFIFLNLFWGWKWWVLCAAAILSRDPSSDLKHKYATTQMCQGCTRCQVCWAVMSKADSLLCADPKSPLPSWPRQLPSLGPQARPQGERHKSAAFKNKAANFSALEAL